MRPFVGVNRLALRRDGEFFARTAAIASLVLKREKDEIFGDHIRAQRRLLAMALMGAALLATLAGVAFWEARSADVARRAAVEEGNRANEEASRANEAANRERAALKVANEQRDKANDALKVATEQRNRADAALQTANIEREAAQRQRDIALSRELTAVVASQIESADPQLNLALLKHAHRLADTEQLFQVLAQWSNAACRAELRGHSSEVLSAAFSPDGLRIVTASDDSTARVWDAATGKPIATLSGHSGRVGSAAFSRDGLRIVTASYDKTGSVPPTVETRRGGTSMTSTLHV